ncbi:MAG: PAS domain-containing protein, partial [Ginsengibacter sp.]
MKKNKNKKTILSSAGNEKLVAVKKKNTTDKTSKGDDERHRLREELRVVKRELINVNKKLSKAKDYTKCIVSTLREPLLILDKNLRVQTANSAFYKAFGGNEKKAKNSLIYELNNGQWNIQELRILMEEVLPEKRSCVGFEIRHHLPHTKDRVLLLNGREIKGEDNSEKIILLAIEDITEERLANDRIKEKEKQYFQLLKTLPVAIYTCDAQGYLTYYNDAAQELWGRKPNVKKDRWG